MPQKVPRTVLSLACLLLITIPAIPAAAQGPQTIERATFVLRSGEVIKDVPFKVDEQFKVIVLDLPEGSRNISFNEIESILVDGQGVTGKILGTSPARQERQARSEQDPVYISSQASPWKFAARVGGSYSVPIGDWYEGIDPGVGFGIEALIPIKRRAALRLCFARAGMNLADQDLSQLVNIHADRYLLAVQVHQYLDKKGDQFGMYYGYAGLGVIDHVSEFKATEQGGTVSYSTSETKFLTNLGGGVILMLNPRWGVDLGANMDLVYLGSTQNSYNYYDASYAMILDVRAGAVLFF